MKKKLFLISAILGISANAQQNYNFGQFQNQSKESVEIGSLFNPNSAPSLSSDITNFDVFIKYLYTKNTTHPITDKKVQMYVYDGILTYANKIYPLRIFETSTGEIFVSILRTTLDGKIEYSPRVIEADGKFVSQKSLKEKIKQIIEISREHQRQYAEQQRLLALQQKALLEEQKRNGVLPEVNETKNETPQNDTVDLSGNLTNNEVEIKK